MHNPMAFRIMYTDDNTTFDMSDISMRQGPLALRATDLVVDPLVIESPGTSVNEENEAVTEVKDEPPAPSIRPPRLADLLLRLCTPPESREALFGCLTEDFNRDCAQFGLRRAIWFYWIEVARSVLPLLGRTIGRLVKWAAILDAIWRHFSS
jgi:hypothetical protein